MDEQIRQGLIQSFESIIQSNPYYDFIDIRLEDIDEGWVLVRLPYSEEVEAPKVGPNGIHGGVINTAIDSAGIASVIAKKGEPIPLTTEDMTVTYHTAADETVLVEAQVISDGSTLVTSRVDVYPEGERPAQEPTLVASGTTTARLFT